MTLTLEKQCTMEAFDDDPFLWSIDQVVAYLCHPSEPWSRFAGSLPRPDPVFLETALRDNDITGRILLTDVDKGTLAHDFGLKSLGQRSAVFSVVEYLRKHSQKYAEHSQIAHLDYPYPPSSTPRLKSSLPPESPNIPFNYPTPVHNALPAVAPPDVTDHSVQDDIESGKQNSKNVLEEQRQGMSLSGPSLRPNEHYVVDKGGRKRRRLALNTPEVAASDFSKENSTQHHWYLLPQKTVYPDLYYNDMEDSDDETFVLTGAECPIGHKRFVYKSLQHYFSQEPISLKAKDGKDAVAIFPYATKNLPKDEPQYFTLFTQDQGVKVTKEDVLHWPQLNQRRGEFDYLLDMYPPEESQDGLPLYGDSESENGYDSETWGEIEAEKEDIKAFKTLSSAEVNNIIDQCIDSYTQLWNDQKRPAQQRKAQRLWLSSRKQNTKLAGIESATRELARLDKRLKGLRKAITDENWSKENEVRQQCLCLEETVFEKEVQKWKKSILELGTCPPKPPAPAAPRLNRPPKPAIPEDEEWLTSGNEDGDDDGLDDFIVPDDENSVPAQAEPVAAPPELAAAPPEPCQISAAISDSEEDIISPKAMRKRRSSNANSRKPKAKLRSPKPSAVKASASPAQMRQRQTHRPTDPIVVVDLTKSSDEASEHNFDVHTPPLNPVNDNIPPSPRLQLLNDFTRIKRKADGACPSSSPQLPDRPDFEAISQTGIKVFEERRDRGRLLRKLVSTVSSKERHDWYEYIQSKTLERMKSRVRKTLTGLLSEKREKSPTLEPGTKRWVLLRITTIYISWRECKSFRGNRGIPKAYLSPAINDNTGFDTFYPLFSDAVGEFLEKEDLEMKASGGPQTKPTTEEKRHGDPTPNRPFADQEQQTQGSDFEDFPSAHSGPEKHSTPHKKRKKAVKESQEAMDSQRSAQRRVERQEHQRKQLAHKLLKTGISNTDPDRQAVSFDNPVIYLHRHIGARVKPHQLSGVQFMWRELIQDEKRQGCLLAHTMGLGKTMQVISLLVTIANAAASDDPEVRKQIPENLRISRTLVLCPSSLIENWWEELMMWMPSDDKTLHNIGPCRKILPTTHKRLELISSWYKEGGILLMSYDIFRSLILNKPRKSGLAILDGSTHDSVRKILLEGPRIIVADEAHKLKNRNAGVAEACSAFKSKSRIALTGSPLANNLKEYYAMIDWIAPGYLGEFVQFKAKYIEPIEEGLYADSTAWERRKSLKKLQVLKKDIDPKLNRADVSVLKGSLPPKVEFVITVPLTRLQEQAYDAYITALEADKKAEVGNTRLWDWLAILSLLCNHPACFMEKIRVRKKVQELASRASPDSDSEIPEEAPISQVLAPEMLNDLEDLIASTAVDLQSIELSHRAQVADQIIQLSVAAGDKVLLFSHSIPTLNYLEHVLKEGGRSYSRLDGKTPITSRQSATKNFNAGSGAQVYLISTRAGGLGLNIPGANRVIIFDFNFNPTWEEQAVGRAYRLGQTKPVYVYRFVAGGTYEDVMYNKAVYKTQLSFRVIDKKNPIRFATKFSKDYLFSPKAVKQMDLTEFKGKDPAVLDNILALQDNIRKIELTETFQREDNDKLTPEEEKAVQEELEDERLKRNDPAAWQKKNKERELREAAARAAPQAPPPMDPLHSFLSNNMSAGFSPLPLTSSMPPPVNPTMGPPALTPDTSLLNTLRRNAFSPGRLFGPLRPNGNASSVPPSPPGSGRTVARNPSGSSTPLRVDNKNRPQGEANNSNNVQSDGKVNNGNQSPESYQNLQDMVYSTSARGEGNGTSQTKIGTSGCAQQ
ncbi:hypothetical protein AJ79_07987 [Helicocarpus griseus UAMH5409]|uniref:SNF2 family helicase/ATPase n=1 Tax=Helicocarpus griseus UAMH5409 TaxID=1447875 RepID=A0A2B7WWN7_9EURO|nr:hypothetical protein AJ79_07987 [Helicocarpus griseus UAMH5409]